MLERIPRSCTPPPASALTAVLGEGAGPQIDLVTARLEGLDGDRVDVLEEEDLHVVEGRSAQRRHSEPRVFDGTGPSPAIGIEITNQATYCNWSIPGRACVNLMVGQTTLGHDELLSGGDFLHG